EVPDHHITIAIANGVRPPGPPEALGLGADTLRRHTVVNHDAMDTRSLVDLGTTARGTRIKINRAAAEADVVVATGRIRPHYFAGYAGGAMPIFPGLGSREDIRSLKGISGSRLGVLAGNPCHEEFEEAAAMLRAQKFLLNLSMAGDLPIGAVAGELRAAHRRG